MNYPTLDKAPIKGSRVLLRADFNLPVDADGTIPDNDEANFRIAQSIPTLDAIMDAQPEKLVIMTHLGDPEKLIKKGVAPDDAYSKLDAEKVCCRLNELWSRTATWHPDINTPTPKRGIFFLQNTRFDPREKSKNPDELLSFANVLASHVQTVEGKGIYINDAFGVSHRAHASLAAITGVLPSYTGLLMEKELEQLGKLLFPPKGSVAVMGGLKVSDKIRTLTNLADKYGTVLIGGAMANIFQKARGYSIGIAEVDDVELGIAKTLLKKYGSQEKLWFPSDFRLGRGKPSSPEFSREAQYDDIADDEANFDIGPATEKVYADKIRSAEMVFWNGPMGVFEDKAFCGGTLAIAKAVADCQGFSGCGGGETVSAFGYLGKTYSSKVSHISTGGGASLEVLSGAELAALKAMRENQNH